MSLDYFFQKLPTKTLHLKEEYDAGGKHSNVNVTGLAAGNTVAKKFAMFIIGKSETRRRFKEVKSLPCQYVS